MRQSRAVENMRVALMDLLGKGGERFRKFDDAYSQAVRDKLMLESGDPRLNNPVGVARNMAGAFAGAPITHGPALMVRADGTEYLPETLVEKIAGYGTPVIGGVSRYALPAAGAALAGKGIVDTSRSIVDIVNGINDIEYQGTIFNPESEFPY